MSYSRRIVPKLSRGPRRAERAHGARVNSLTGKRLASSVDVRCGDVASTRAFAKLILRPMGIGPATSIWTRRLFSGYCSPTHHRLEPVRTPTRCCSALRTKSSSREKRLAIPEHHGGRGEYGP